MTFTSYSQGISGRNISYTIGVGVLTLLLNACSTTNTERAKVIPQVQPERPPPSIVLKLPANGNPCALLEGMNGAKVTTKARGFNDLTSLFKFAGDCTADKGLREAVRLAVAEVKSGRPMDTYHTVLAALAVESPVVQRSIIRFLSEEDMTALGFQEDGIRAEVMILIGEMKNGATEADKARAARGLLARYRGEMYPHLGDMPRQIVPYALAHTWNPDTGAEYTIAYLEELEANADSSSEETNCWRGTRKVKGEEIGVYICGQFRPPSAQLSLHGHLSRNDPPVF